MLLILLLNPTVSLFTHEWNKNDNNDNITNEREDDSHFIIKF